MSVTKISDLVNPMVMADAISAKLEKKIVVSPFARLDYSLSGVPGDTIYVPQYSYIGDAADVAEGETAETSKLVATTAQATVKKAMKAVELTDEAILSGYGNPLGEANNQLAMAIASKVESDAMEALQSAQVVYDAQDSNINYSDIVDAIDLFDEEVNSEKVMFVHPKQMSQLRHDENFISADKYPGAVMMNGEIGMIANVRIVSSKRVPLNTGEEERYYFCSSSDTGAMEVVESGASGSKQVLLSAVIKDLPSAKPGDIVKLTTAAAVGKYYINPIVKTEYDSECEDEAPALTIYVKRDTNVETQRHSLKRCTEISVDKLYTAVLSNSSKVVLANFKK